MDTPTLEHLRQQTIESLRRAATAPTAMDAAIAQLLAFMRAVVQDAARTQEHDPRTSLEDGVSAACARLQQCIAASGLTEPAHIVYLAESIIRGTPRAPNVPATGAAQLTARAEAPTRRQIPGIFKLLQRAEHKHQARTQSLDVPLAQPGDAAGAPRTLADLLPTTTGLTPAAAMEFKSSLCHWVEELAYAAEATEETAKRATLNALLLYLKWCVALCHPGARLQQEHLPTVRIEQLLAHVDLSGFDATLLAKTKSQWTMRSEVSTFLVEVMDLSRHDRAHAQNRVRQRVNRVCAMLCRIRTRCQTNLFAVEGLCDDCLHVPGDGTDTERNMP